MRELADAVLPVVIVPVDLAREFERRLPEWSRLAFRVAYSVLRQREDAEDVAQDALVRAHQRLDRLRDPDKVRGWLVRISWRLALDHRKSARRRERREDAARASDAVPARAVEDMALWAAVDTLPEKLQIVLVLAALHGHDMQEIAQLLQVPVGTVKSRLFLARQRLAEVLR